MSPKLTKNSPPGTGKTHTAAAIVGLVSSSTPRRRILFLGPSNTAVDQAAFRLMELKLLNGTSFRPNVVRIGRQENISQQMKAYSLETLLQTRMDQLVVEYDQFKKDQAQLEYELILAQEGGDSWTMDIATSRLEKAKAATKAARQELDPRKQRERVFTESHVICATLAGAGTLYQWGMEFDCILVDEAQQCTEVDVVAAYSLAHEGTRLILIGDPAQLPAIVHGPVRCYNYEQPLLERLACCQDKTVYWLDTQYRMAPSIGDFVSRTFYENRFVSTAVDQTGMPWCKDSGNILWYNVLGDDRVTVAHSRIRDVEIPVILSLLRELQDAFKEMHAAKNPSIGIITMYAAQRDRLLGTFDSAKEAGGTSWIPE